MIVLLLCLLTAFCLFGVYMIWKGCEIQEQNEKIYELLLDLKNRLDLHKL